MDADKLDVYVRVGHVRLDLLKGAGGKEARGRTYEGDLPRVRQSGAYTHHVLLRDAHADQPIGKPVPKRPGLARSDGIIVDDDDALVGCTEVHDRVGKSVATVVQRTFWALVPHQIDDSEGDAPYYVATIPLATFLQWSLPPEFVNAILHGEVIEGPEAMEESDRCRFRQWVLDSDEGSDAMSDVMLMEMEARLHRLAASFADSSPERSVTLDASRSSDVETMAVFVAANYQQSLQIKDSLGPGNLLRQLGGQLVDERLGEHCGVDGTA